jgi:ferredoxin
MRFICPKHGEFEPKSIMYSCPAIAVCPVCNSMVEDSEGGIREMREEEAVLIRPEFYKKRDKGKTTERYLDKVGA